MHNVSFQFKNMVYPQILACTPKMGTQRVLVPSAENWSGHADINYPGHMTKMAAMSISGKDPSKIFFFPEAVDQFQQNLACSVVD